MPDIIFKLTELQEVFFFLKHTILLKVAFELFYTVSFFFNWINPVS